VAFFMVIPPSRLDASLPAAMATLLRLTVCSLGTALKDRVVNVDPAHIRDCAGPGGNRYGIDRDRIFIKSAAD